MTRAQERWCVFASFALSFAAIPAIIAMPARAASPAEHTVSWYAAHADERRAVLGRCNDDRSLDSDDDCRNATAGAAQAGRPGFIQGPDAFAANNDAATYRSDGFRRGMVLGACKTNRPPPQAWCRAAQQAQDEMRQ